MSKCFPTHCELLLRGEEDGKQGSDSKDPKIYHRVDQKGKRDYNLTHSWNDFPYANWWSALVNVMKSSGNFYSVVYFLSNNVTPQRWQSSVEPPFLVFSFFMLLVLNIFLLVCPYLNENSIQHIPSIRIADLFPAFVESEKTLDCWHYFHSILGAKFPD